MMRSQVRMLGRFQAMTSAYRSSGARVQVIIDDLRKCRPDSFDLRQVRHAGAQHALQAAEMRQQCTALAGTKPRHGLQHRLLMPPRAAPPMPLDGKAMRLVADALD